MISIGIFTYSTKPRGSVVHAAYLAEALQRRGADVTLYALSKAGDAFYRPVSCDLRLISAGPAPSDMDLLIRQRIAEFRAGLEELRPRHAVGHAEDCLAASALVAARESLGDLRVVRTVHHVERFDSPYLMDCQARSVAEADLVLSVSEMTRSEVHRTFEREAQVVSNGVDVARFAQQGSWDRALFDAVSARFELAPDDPLILSVGGVEPRKNSLGALSAVALAFERRPNLRWVIAGGASIWEHDEYRSEFARRLAELPAALRARITVLGNVPESELTALYQRSDLLLCPSLQEGFGLCVLEALAANTAVIVPSGPPFGEYLDEGSARFVDPSSPRDIARALTELLGDGAERKRLAENGLLRAARYSWDRVAERHLAHYESLLHGAPHAA